MNDNNMMNVALTSDNAAWLLNVLANQVRQLGAIVDAQGAELAKLRESAKPAEEKKND